MAEDIPYLQTHVNHGFCNARQMNAMSYMGSNVMLGDVA